MSQNRTHPIWGVSHKFMQSRKIFEQFAFCCAVISTILLTACGGPARNIGEKFAEVALNTVGLKNATHTAPSRKVALRIEAAKDLNAGDDGQGLATVMRLYKLRDHNGFLSAPYSSFGTPEKEKQVIGTDLLEVRELTLAPGQRLLLEEKMTGDAAYLGVVTLFRSPSAQRWRFAFAAAERSAITLGLHACAMTATSVAPVGMDLEETALLSSTNCK